MSRKIGRFELAHGGTLFLDEIGELPLALQAKLLRVLQEGEFERVGSSVTRKVDVRVIAASNRNLADAVRDGTFRPDLYYRLRVFPIEMPPLRARKEDIPLLVWHFLGHLARTVGKKIERVPAATMARLVAYDWPGNIRELRNVLERAVVLSPVSALRLDALGESLQAASAGADGGGRRSDARGRGAGAHPPHARILRLACQGQGQCGDAARAQREHAPLADEEAGHPPARRAPEPCRPRVESARKRDGGAASGLRSREVHVH